MLPKRRLERFPPARTVCFDREAAQMSSLGGVFAFGDILFESANLGPGLVLAFKVHVGTKRRVDGALGRGLMFVTGRRFKHVGRHNCSAGACRVQLALKSAELHDLASGQCYRGPYCILCRLS